jgi:hypothetical protein
MTDSQAQQGGREKKGSVQLSREPIHSMFSGIAPYAANSTVDLSLTDTMGSLCVFRQFVNQILQRGRKMAIHSRRAGSNDA